MFSETSGILPGDVIDAEEASRPIVVYLFTVMVHTEANSLAQYA